MLWTASGFILFCICSLCVSGSNGTVQLKTRISGGTITTSREHPYVVALSESWYEHNEHSARLVGPVTFCSGSIVHEFAVVTAAHCVHYADTDLMRIIVGAAFKDDKDSLVVPVTRLLTNPDYLEDTIVGDIALVYAQTSLLKDNKGKIIPLARFSDFHDWERVTIVGWGWSSFSGKKATKLMKGFMSTKACFFDNLGNPARYFCLKSNTTTSIEGDSGGPVVQLGRPDKLIGVISGGSAPTPDDNVDDTEIFERNAEAVSIGYYRDWIIEHFPK